MKSPKSSPEMMELAVRMVFDAKDQYPSHWAAIESIAGKIGCARHPATSALAGPTGRIGPRMP